MKNGNKERFKALWEVVVRLILAMQLKKNFRKGCQIFATHMEEADKNEVASIEDHLVLKYFEDVFEEIPRFPLKRDIDFSIELVPKSSLVSKTPYRMGTLELK